MKTLRTILMWGLVLWAGWSLTAQNNGTTLWPVGQTKLEADTFWGKDASGALYYSLGNTFYKKTPQQTYVYTYNSYGALAQVDVLNPLRLLLFFKSAQVVVVLDNQCNEVDQMRLGDLPGGLWLDRVSMAGQQYWWGFDLNSNRWGLIDSRNNLWRAVGPVEIQPIRACMTNYNQAQWVNAQGQWWRMDLFGEARLVAEGLPPTPALLFVDAQQLLYQADGLWWLLRADASAAQSLLWNAKWPFAACYTNQILAIFDGTEMVEYQLK